MPDMPTPQQVHIDRYLTNMSIIYQQEVDIWIAGKVFPELPVLKKSDLYVKFPKGYFMRDEMEPRPLGGRPRATGYEIEKGTYSCEEEALEHKIDDRVRENADQPIEPDLRGMELLTEKALIHRDKEWAASFFKTGVWGSDWTFPKSKSSEENVEKREGPKFSNYEGAVGAWVTTPVQFFDQRSTEMREKTGKRPNKLVLGAKLYNVLKNHPELLERIKYNFSTGAPAMVTPSIMAQLFGVEDVLIAEAVENVAPEGKADNIKFIVDTESAMLVYAAPSPSIMTPSAGYIFAWTGLIPGVTNAMGGVLVRGREELAHTDVLQIRVAFDMQATATDLGMFFSKAM
jgi:hypothetical protein